MRWPTMLGVGLTAALVAGAAMAQVGPRPSSEAVRHYTAGVRALKQGALERAEAELEEAVRREPNYLEALSSLALVYHRRGKQTHYRAVLERAATVKAGQAPPPGLSTPRLAPPEPPGGRPPPAASQRPRPTRARRPRWRHQGPEPREVFVLDREANRGPLNHLHIEGTVKNNTARTVRRVVVAIVALNAEGRPVDPPLTYRGPWELAPGEEASFRLEVVDADDRIERFDLKASWEPVEE